MLTIKIKNIEFTELQERRSFEETGHGGGVPSNVNRETFNLNRISASGAEGFGEAVAELSQLLNTNQGTERAMPQFVDRKSALQTISGEIEYDLPKNVLVTGIAASKVRSRRSTTIEQVQWFGEIKKTPPEINWVN